MKDSIKQTTRYEGVFQIHAEAPKLNHATIIVSDVGDAVTVGVKAVYSKFTKGPEGVSTSLEQVGDYCIVNKTCTVEELFGKMEEMLASVSKMVDTAQQGNKNGEQA